jgi:mono/diheme cytochrome c family protein
MKNCCFKYVSIAAVSLVALVTSGCEPARPPQFVFDQALERAARDDLKATSEHVTKAKEEAQTQEEKDDLDKLLAQKEEFLKSVPQRQRDVANVLTALFGTPDLDLPDDQHKALGNIWRTMGLDAKKIRLAAGPTYSDAQGYAAGLYRRHCVHCHGVTGDGAGPTAMFLNPYPRDFRHGAFKFKSTRLGDKPTDDDLRRTLQQGIPGTAMPSFKLLATTEIDALVEYVKYLAIRGETEKSLLTEVGGMQLGESLVEYDGLRAAIEEHSERLTATGDETRQFVSLISGENGLVAKFQKATTVAPLNLVSEAEELLPQANALIAKMNKAGNKDAAASLTAVRDAITAVGSSFRERITEMVNLAAVTRWKQAGEKVVIPEERPPVSESELDASIKLGRELFFGRGNCFSCHGASAQGDETQYVLNAPQGTANLWPTDKPTNLLVNSMLPPQTLRPRNLRTGVFRGGGRPIDVYRRIEIGIDNTPMPAAPAGNSGLKDEREKWALVDYVRTLQYELTPAVQKDQFVHAAAK